MFVVDAHQMREMDRFTMDTLGIPGIILMEHAGRAVADEIRLRGSFRHAVILCGHGNNGGDGMVIARYLHQRSCAVTVFLLGDPQKMSSDSQFHMDLVQKQGIQIETFNGDWQHVTEALSHADLIVDAMLGTGAKGSLREPVKTAVNLVNDVRSGIGIKPVVVAVDLPTGIDADNGQLMDTAVKADLTVTFAFPKWGHFLYPGKEYVGELKVKDIGIPDQAIEHVGCSAHILTPEAVAQAIPRRIKHSHKGTYGHVLLISGSHEMRGAPVLAGNAALRSGAGMVTMAVPASILSQVSSQVTEAIMWAWPEHEGHFENRPLSQISQWHDRKERFSCVAVGPGMGTWPQGEEWIDQIFSHFSCPLILDADALNLVARNPDILQHGHGPVVITPHPGEMARLTGLPVTEVERSRPQVAKNFAKQYQVYVVLKGTHTIIAAPDGRMVLNMTGSPSMAKGGSGDVLTGIISSFIAQISRNDEANLLDAIAAAVHIHGLTGEICGKQSEYSTLASDMIRHIGTAISQVLNG